MQFGSRKQIDVARLNADLDGAGITSSHTLLPLFYHPAEDSRRPGERAVPPAWRKVLFLDPDEQAGRCVHRHRQLRTLPVRAEDDVPDQLIAVATPVANVSDRNIRRLLQNLVTAVFLRGGQRLVRIDLQKLYVPGLHGGIRRIVTVLNSKTDAAGRSPFGRAS